MRRKDREVTDRTVIDEIIRSCGCIRLGLNDSGEVYIVPMNFGYEHDGEKRVFYMHCAKEGRKLDIIRENPKIG
nr:pyridoxamine 5'-phosphate oxidase family protein [Clostridia bacterium]